MRHVYRVYDQSVVSTRDLLYLTRETRKCGIDIAVTFVEDRPSQQPSGGFFIFGNLQKVALASGLTSVRDVLNT